MDDAPVSTTRVPSARLDLRGLERAEAGLLDVHSQTEATPRPGRSRVLFRLLGARGAVVETPQQLVEERGEIARVVDRADAERLGPAVVGHLVCADHVAAPNLGRIEAQARGGLIEQTLTCEVALRTAGRAQCAGRRLVGHHRPEIAGVARHSIRPGQQRGAELGGHERGCAHVGADVGTHHRAHAQDAAVGGQPHLNLVGDLARVVGRHEVLAAALDPLDGPAEHPGGERDQDVFGIKLAPHAEAAADIDLGEPERARGQAEDGRQDGAVDVDALRRADQMQLPPARIGRHRHQPAGL
jgi:hypothetical protein